MINNTKSSITLPPEELRVVKHLMKKLGAKTKVEVIRQGLRLLKERTDRNSLREAFKTASRMTRKSLSQELPDLDHLAGEGVD